MASWDWNLPYAWYFPTVCPHESLCLTWHVAQKVGKTGSTLTCVNLYLLGQIRVGGQFHKAQFSPGGATLRIST